MDKTDKMGEKHEKSESQQDAGGMSAGMGAMKEMSSSGHQQMAAEEHRQSYLSHHGGIK